MYYCTYKFYNIKGLNQQNPTVERTAKEVKKKWENLATLARKEIAEFRSGTGRSLLRPPSALTLKILELIDDISFNNPPSDGSFAVVKEEIWDDDTDSAEMSPSNVHSSNESASLQQTFNSSNNNQISSYSSTSSNNTVIPPYEAPAPLPVQAPAPVARPFVGHSFSLNNNNPNNKRPFTPQDDFCFDLYSLKKRKLHLESEKLELENEKLRLEMDILRLKFNSMKKQRGDPTVIIADDDGDNYNNKEESVEDSDTSRQ